MAGIRVRSVPKNAKDKHLKIHFSKPQHGGGRIKKIYFPLFNNDAVILFDDKKVIEEVLRQEHSIGHHVVEVQGLPEHMVFSTMDARLDDAASVIVQVTPVLRDEMEYSEGIKLVQEKDQSFRLQGNWFQLEWAWHYIDCFMQQQEVIQHEISQQPQRYAGQPMEVDENDVQENFGKSSLYRNSPTEINTDLRRNIAERSRLESSLNGARQKARQSDQSAHYDDDTVPSLSYRGSPGSSHRGSDHHDYREPKSHYDDVAISSPKLSPHDNISSHYDDVAISSPKLSPHDNISSHYDDVAISSPKLSPRDNISSLKSNINTSYEDKYNHRNYSSQSFHEDSDDEDLHGTGHKIPYSSMQSTINKEELRRRSEDENSTFREFSGLQSMNLVSTDKSVGSHLKDDSSRRDSAHHESNTSAESQTSLSSPYSKSLSLSPSRKEGLGKSGKQSLDAVDHSLGLNKPRLPARSTEIPARYTEDQLCQTFDIRGVMVTIYFGNLTKEETDAIVNAANEQLEHYGGIAYAILRARGREMEEECRSYVRKNGSLKTSGVTHTSGGGDIKSSHIIHAAGPMWLSDRLKDKFIFQLTQTFLNCLEYAEKQLWIKSIALPAISSGVYGAPLDTCVRCFLDAVLIFTHQQGGYPRLKDIRLVNNDAESTVTSIVLVQTLLEHGIETLTADAEDFMGKYERDNRELGLPRGRKDGASSFSKTYVKDKTDVGYSSIYTSPVADKVSVSASARRRSSSLSRVPDKKPVTGEVRKYDSHKGQFMSESDSKSSASSTSRVTEKHRERTGSMNLGLKKDSNPNFRNTISGATGTKSRDSLSQSTKRASATESTRKSAPKIKSALLTSDKMKLKGTSTSKKSEHIGLRTSDDYGAFTRAGKSTPSYKMHTDTSEDDDDFGLKSLPADLHSHSYREKFLQTSSSKPEVCAICLDDVKDPTQLQCKHKFCSYCIRRHFKSSKPSCPTCGALYGRVVGDQPRGGRMTHVTDRSRFLPGYENEDGMIVITYTFPDGAQESCHPQPGRSYKGITRKAFLPNCVEGREVLRLLKKAFDNRLVFTVGDSKTRGESGVLTWNDIHHKTSVGGGPTRFGYPDPGYLRRVKDELADKGITSDK